MKAEEFDQKFDDNEHDLLDDLDLSTIKRPNQKSKKVNVDFPTWMVESLDKRGQSYRRYPPIHY